MENKKKISKLRFFLGVIFLGILSIVILLYSYQNIEYSKMGITPIEYSTAEEKLKYNNKYALINKEQQVYRYLCYKNKINEITEEICNKYSLNKEIKNKNEFVFKSKNNKNNYFISLKSFANDVSKKKIARARKTFDSLSYIEIIEKALKNITENIKKDIKNVDIPEDIILFETNLEIDR